MGATGNRNPLILPIFDAILACFARFMPSRLYAIFLHFRPFSCSRYCAAVPFSPCSTERKQAASAWLEKRKTELAKPGALERLKEQDPTLALVIDRYVDESIKEIGRTKAQVLRAIKSYDIANKNCSKIGSEDIVAFANQLVAKVTPQTVANYLSHLVQFSLSPGPLGDIRSIRAR
jgi:hypothetical protein